MDIPHEPCEECGRRENTVVLCPDCFARAVQEHPDMAALRGQIAKQQAEMAELRKEIGLAQSAQWGYDAGRRL